MKCEHEQSKKEEAETKKGGRKEKQWEQKLKGEKNTDE